MNPQEAAASKSIEALLTDSQKTKLPNVLKQFSAFQPAGLPLEIADKINLTEAQREKIAAIAEASRAADRKAMDEARASGDFESIRTAMQESRKAVRDKALTVLTDDQKKLVTDWVSTHPQRGPGFGGPGGPGGFGGPGDGNGPPPGGPN